MLCKWDGDTDDGGRENWLPVCLGKCSENNTWDVFWLTRKDTAEKLAVSVKWRRGYSCKMIQRYLEPKPACDMLQDSGQWGFDILSLNHSDKHLLEQIESYLTPIQIFSVEREHYVTLSTAMPKIKYLLDKLGSCACSLICILHNNSKTVCKDDLYGHYVNLCIETNKLDVLVHGLLFAAAEYLDPRFKSFEPFVHVSDRKESIAFAEKHIKLYHKSLSQCDHQLQNHVLNHLQRGQSTLSPIIKAFHNVIKYHQLQSHVLNHLQRGQSFMCLQWMMTTFKEGRASCVFSG